MLEYTLMDNTSQNKIYLPYIDGLRAIAALYVVMHHAMLEYGIYPVNYLQNKFISMFRSGHYAVDLFIVISGFSLMLPTIKRNHNILSIGDFYKRRIKRILPPYYIALFFSLLAIWFLIGNKSQTFWDISIPVTSKSIITHILLISDVFTSDVFKINFSLWSIPVECRIYLFFPLLLYIWRKGGPGFAIPISVIISIFLLATLRILRISYPEIDLVTSGVNPYIILFTLGMLAADVSFNTKLSKILDKWPWGLFLILLFGIFVFYKNRLVFKIEPNGNIAFEIADVLFGLVCFCLLIVCSKTTYNESKITIIKRIFSFAPLVTIGAFSYSIYLIHAPLLHIIAIYIINPFHFEKFISTVILIFFGTGIIIAVSYIFYILFERPFFHKKKAKI